MAFDVFHALCVGHCVLGAAALMSRIRLFDEDAVIETLHALMTARRGTASPMGRYALDADSAALGVDSYVARRLECAAPHSSRWVDFRDADAAHQYRRKE